MTNLNGVTLTDDSGQLIATGLQIDDGVYIVSEWTSSAVPIAGLLARATNLVASGTLSEFLVSNHAAVVPPLRLFGPLLTVPNPPGPNATRTLTRVPGNYATDNLTPHEAQQLLLSALKLAGPMAFTWHMTSAFANNLAVLPNDNLAAATTRELWEITVSGIKRAVIYSWAALDANGTPLWFKDYCFSTKIGSSALVTLPLKLLPGTNISIGSVHSFTSQNIPDLSAARSDAAARLQVAANQLGVGRVASTAISTVAGGITAQTTW